MTSGAGTGPARRAGAGAAVALAAVIAGCAHGTTTAAPSGTLHASLPASARPSPRHTGTSLASDGPPTRATRKPAASPSALPVGAPGAAARPQTTAKPRVDDDAFDDATHDIWLAVSTGDPRYALPAFFPEKAYQQVKTIYDPDVDWRGRLWGDFTLDVAAAHKLVKPGSVLVKVVAPTEYAHWVPAGVCDNRVGYWEMPGARVVYREAGATHSFGIASMISWRGNWYVVHFGGVVRGAYGLVDDPEPGAGVPGPPGGC